MSLRQSTASLNTETAQLIIPEGNYNQKGNKQLGEMNEFRIKLNYLTVSESVQQQRSPLIRVEMVLRDSYGNVYDTIRD
jgi:hypothetical protein